MKKSSKKSKLPAPVQVSISMRAEQLRAIDSAAREENRSRSNWIMTLVASHLSKRFVPEGEKAQA